MRAYAPLSACVVLLALAAAGCGAARERAPLTGGLSLEQARTFDDFPLYYAGGSVDGLPLAAIVHRDDTARYVSFIYGECEPAASDQGCAPPAEIQVWPSTARNLGSYDVSAPGTPVPERTTVNGVDAAFVEGGQLEVFTPRATVVVFGDSRARLVTVAKSLVCVATPGRPLGKQGC